MKCTYPYLSSACTKKTHLWLQNLASICLPVCTDTLSTPTVITLSHLISRSSGLCRRVVLWWDADVSEEHAVSILRVKWRSSDMLVSCCNAARHHNPEDLNMNPHHSRNLKSRSVILCILCIKRSVLLICLHVLAPNGCGAHPASYPMSTGGSFPGGKATGLWSWPLTSI
jgi:hypothetical protein